MTNREKFAEQILDIACSNNAIAVDKATLETIACGKSECKDCLFNVSDVMSCGNKRIKWANSEYVEPPVDWSKVAVDTPILVRDNSFSEWGKRYFAKYENGGVYAWSNGTTSWSGDRCTPWKLAKLPERSSNGEINNQNKRRLRKAKYTDENQQLIDKLAEYEDLEKQSRLIKLPCKVGDDVYYILGIPNETPCVIDKCTFELSDINKIGKTLFLTKSEAEAKLKELRGGKNEERS